MELERDWSVTAPAAAGAASSVPAAKSAAKPDSGGGVSFGQVLSMLNPLQYVPVVGMIYRGLTGDTIPEPARIAGGFVFSALTGGPIGMALTAAADVAEEALGFDPDKLVHAALVKIGLAGPDKAGPDKAAAKGTVQAAVPGTTAAPTATAPASARSAFTGQAVMPSGAAVAPTPAATVEQVAARSAAATGLAAPISEIIVTPTGAGVPTAQSVAAANSVTASQAAAARAAYARAATQSFGGGGG